MKVLITGASGFIGQNLAHTLASAGIEVRAIFRTPQRFSPPICVLPEEARKFYEETVVDEAVGGEAGTRIFKGIDAVVHLAAKVHDPESLQRGDDSEFIKTNCEYTMTLARMAQKAGVKKFIFISSVKAMGEEGILRLDADPRPRDAYGKSKMAAEAALSGMFGNGGTGECVVLYLPMVYGPGNKGNMITLLHAAAGRIPLPFAALTGKRSFLFVGNFCDAVRRILLAEEAGHSPVSRYFLHDGTPCTSGEFYSMIYRAMNGTRGVFYIPHFLLRTAASAGTLIEKISGKRMPFSANVLGKVAHEYRIESVAFEKGFGWRPPFSPEEGIARTVEWYLAARHLSGKR